MQGSRPLSDDQQALVDDASKGNADAYNQARGLSSDDLAQAEQGGGGLAQKNTPEESERASLNDNTDNDSGWKNNTGKKSSKRKGLLGRFTGKQKGVAGGVAVVMIAGSIGLSIITAPGFIINNLREVMSRMSDVQVHHSRRYRRTNFRKISDVFSKDGRLSGKVFTEMEADGYRFIVKDNKVVGLSTPYPENRTLVFDGVGDHIEDYMEVKHPLRSSRWKTKRMNALYSRYGVTRTSIVAATGEAIDDPDKIINQRIARNTLDRPVDVNNALDEPPDDETDAERDARESRNKALNEASETGGVVGEVRESVLEGENLDKAARRAGIDAGGDAVEQFGTGAGAGALDAAKKVASDRSFTSKLGSSLKGLLSPTDILDRVCTMKNRLRMSVMLARSQRSLALLKYSSLFIGVADGVRTGNVEPKLLNSVMKRVTADDRSGNPIGASPGFAYALKGKFTKNKNDAARSSYSVDGKLTGTWKGVQEATDGIPGTSRGQCGAIQNPIFQIGTGVVFTVGKAALCIVTFGAGCAASQAVESGTRLAVTQAVKVAIQNSIRNIITKQGLRKLALNAVEGLAIEIGFEAIMALTQLHIDKTLALPVTGQEKGGELGSILTAGEGAANKQRSLAAGMVPATSQQYSEAEAEYLAYKNEELGKRSFFARIFDLSSVDSLAFQTIMSQPLGLEGYATTLRSYVADFGSMLLGGGFIKNFTNIFNGKAVAAVGDELSYDEYKLEKGKYEGQSLAVDFAGNPLVIMRSDIAAIDPKENIDNLVASGDIDPDTYEPLSEQFRNHVVNCVDNIDILSRIEFEDDASSPEKDCLAQNPVTVRFKAHLAFMDMMDGFEAEFTPGAI